MTTIQSISNKEIRLRTHIEATLLKASSFIGEAILHIKSLEGNHSENENDLIKIRQILIDMFSGYIQ